MESKEILDGLKGIGEKIDMSKSETTKTITEFKTSVDEKLTAAEKIVKDIEKKNSDVAEDLNKKMADQGKTVGEIATALEELKKKQGKYSAMGGPEAKNLQDVLKDAISENIAEIKKLTSGGTKMNLELKVGNITIGNVSSTGSAVNAPYSYVPGYVTRPSRQVNIRDLVSVVEVATGTVIFYRQPVGSTGGGSFGFQAGQGNTKAQLDYNLQQVITPLDYLAGWAVVARQMMDDMPGFLNFITTQLLEDYRRSESNAFVPSLYSQSTPFTPASTVTAERIVQSIADLKGQDWGPNGIVTDAATWAKLLITKPNDYSLPGGGSAIQIDTAGTVYFLGIPVVVQNNMAPGTVIVGDFTQATIFQKDTLNVQIFEQDLDNVRRNLITCRAESRVAFAVLRSDAFERFVAGAT